MKRRKIQTLGRSTNQKENSDRINRKPGRKDESSIKNGQNQHADIFPRYSEWIVFLVTILLRFHYVSQKQNWWILHPDEIFQSMEVAFSELHGYGFRPYEFLPPASGPNVTSARAQERMLGMYALRSFIYPRLLAGVGYVGQLLGFHGSLYIVWRMFHAGITSCLPLSTYVFCRNATGNRDISVISCILVASSTHLWVFGTHTFLNSFLSPFVFIILGYLTSFLTALSNEKNTENCEETYKKEMEHNNNIQIQQNGNGVHSSPFSVDQLKSNSVKKVSRTDFSPCSVFLMGYFTGLFIYMRPDLCVLLITVLSPHIPSVLVRFKHIISHFELYVCIVSSVMGILTGALDDFLSYGRFVVTPLQWLSFNVLNGYAKRMFGTMPNSFYIHIFFGNIILIFLSLCIICVFVYTINKSSVVLVFFRKSLFSFTSLFIIYSYQGHKEARFLHDAIVVFYICSGVSLYFCVQEISYRLRSFCDCRYVEHVTHWFFLLWFISSQYQMMPNSRDNSIKLWAYEEKTDSHDVNVCLDFISQQSEVTGVFIDRDMHMTGGYSILKKNIPWFSLINTEFREFSKKSRLELQSFYGTRKVSTTSQISNYIHIQNTPFLLKCLIRQKEYNYLVMKITRQFINQGYVEVFRYGTMRVLKRSSDLQEEKMLTTLERTISDSKNSTILKYEGQWLAMYGNYDLAKEKFSRAAEIQSDLQVHQFLIELHRKISEPENTKAVFKNCLQKFSSDDCLKPAEKIALFEHERITLR